MFASSSRGELREVWRQAWRKHREDRPLEPLEAQLVDILLEHPEYHSTLEADPEALGRDWLPEDGESNPFLHMGLHLAVREGVATDRPAGIRSLFEALRARHGTGHAAEHLLLECLAETLWEAQRGGNAPDDVEYLEKARRRLGGAK